MADQMNSNQLARKLKQFDAKEPDPSIVNIWELRDRNANKELQAPCIRSPPPGLVHIKIQSKLLTKISAYHHQLTKVPQHELPQFHLSPVPM